MNMFYLSTSPQECAEWSVNSHCVKMILESAQLLSTAHRLLDGAEYTDKTKTGRNVKRWCLPDWRDDKIYTATHMNHPCAVWCRETSSNYRWLHGLLIEYCKEYTFRYGKTHVIDRSGLLSDLSMLPKNIHIDGFLTPPSCMDTKYIISEDPIINYRNYYKYGKAHLHKWKERQPPYWILDYMGD